MLTIPGYELKEQIFESRNSLVFRAERESDRQPVILKVQAQPFPPPGKIAAFKREYGLVQSLDLPGVVRAYRLESHHGRLVMVLEDFGGESLRMGKKHRRWSIEQFLKVAAEIAEILAAVHQRRVMHKDINPSNIVINAATGTLKLIDFGISTVLSRENPALHSSNVLEGTLAYISPEQTGRMNRVIDYRTDFYSLGVTFYELLTGALPFEAGDPVEMIHCHIARTPAPPHEREPSLPLSVSAIVMKLMEKNAEDRYQSARGIRADLEECLRRLPADPRIAPFPLGKSDATDRFQMPQKLYGREREIEALMAAFARVAEGATEMILVSGHAGMGKSALVREIYKPITQQRGYFITGKFDQFQRNTPLASIVQAFQSLVRQILTESEQRITAWKDDLLAALGQNGGVIAEAIPELCLIIGTPREVPALPTRETQNRFNLVFQSFISVFAKREHPLVLFLDDLQWADTGSLSMIEMLMTGPSGRHLLVIGAYRDNEVGLSHPLTSMVSAIREGNGVVGHISPKPLSPASVGQLIADAVGHDPSEFAALAEFACAKTNGNPFFLNEFLKSLNTEGLLVFDHGRGAWVWDIDRIAMAGVADNVVDLMVAKVRRLDPKTQQVLQLAACIGSNFDLMTLAIVHEKPPKDTASDLWEALSEGLVLPLGDSYRLMDQDVHGLAEAVRAEYKFAHDRVQQAAYLVIPEEEKQAVHHRIGQLLLQSVPAALIESRIFDIVNQLNQGRQRIERDEERIDLARLNLLAGKKAKASAAYLPALEYLKVGIELAGNIGWEQKHELTLALHVEAAEAACFATEFQEMERLAEVVLHHGRGTLEKAEVYDVMLQGYIALNKSVEAVKAGLHVLSLLGINVPEKPSPADIQQAMEETASVLAGIKIEQLADLPEMTDPNRLLETRINNRILPPAFRVAPGLFPLLAPKTITLLVRHGNNAQAPFSYALYGLLLCAIGEIELGCRYGQLAMDLIDKFHATHLEARTKYIATAFIGHWRDSMHKGIAPLTEAYRAGVATGDFEFAGFSALMCCCFSYFTGRSLDEVSRESAVYVQAIGELRQETPLQYTRIHHQAILNLTGDVAIPWCLKGESYDEEAMLPVHLAANDLISVGYAALNRLMLCYLFERHDLGLLAAALAEQHLPSLASMPHVPLVHFYVSLVRLATARGLPQPERDEALKKVAASQDLLKKYADHAPTNHSHKLALVEAEHLRVLGEDARAMESYWRAIRLAESNKFLNEEALANEVFARFWLGKGAGEIAQVYMRRAHQLYRLWGATAKVTDLATRYPELLWQGGAGQEGSSDTRNVTSTTGSTEIDLRTVMKASQTISGEIVLSELLTKMMRIVIENAGAQRGVLMLLHEGKLFIEAEGAVDERGVTVLQHRPMGPSEEVATAVVNYVARTNESMVLRDASVEGSVVNDPYVMQARPKSVLAMPVIHQGKRIGLLYVENNLVAGAFTPDRVEVLGLLCTQAAISLENGVLYRTLEERVAERTLTLRNKTEELELALVQIKKMQEQVIVQQKMASLGALTAGIAHEIRNPLNFVCNFSAVSLELLAELRAEIEPKGPPSDANEVLASLEQSIGKIREHGDRASKIISSMLAHSGAPAREPEATNINALLDGIVNLVSYGKRLEETSQVTEIIKDYDVAIEPIRIIPQEIGRVLLNILNNAYYAAQEKRRAQGAGFIPSVRVVTRAIAGGIQVRVRDNGDGIPAALLDKLFTPFFTTKPPGKGVGLGLSLSYDIVVRQHGGSLSVETKEGSFAEFVVTLPR